MKTIATFCILLGTWNYTQAQSFDSRAYLEQQSRRVQAEILTRQTSRSLPNARTTGTDKRLVAQSRYTHNTLTDSIHHYYSGNRGSSLSNYKSYILPDRRYTKFPFDLLETAQYIQSDSSTWYSDLNTTPRREWAMYNQYDSRNKVIREDVMKTQTHDVGLITYNAAGKESTLTTWRASSVPQDSQFHYFRYDAQDRLILDSMVGARRSYGKVYNKIQYYYNSAGLPERLEMQEDSTSLATPGSLNRILYTYDAQGRLLTSESHFYSSLSGWLALYRDTFGYTGNEAQYTHFEFQHRDLILAEWVSYITRTYELNTSGGIRKSYETDMAGDTIQIQNYFYTPEGLYDRIEDVSPDNNAPITVIYHYYETYSSSSVPAVPAETSGAFTLYPNPAQTTLSISIQDPGTIGITIYDITGKAVKDQPVTGAGLHTIDILDLPAGSYLVRSNGADPTVQKFSVIR